MTSKTYTHAGVSRLPNGTVKARFANDALRVKVLAKGGHTDIDLVEFTTPLTKVEAVQKLIEMNFANGNAEIQAALDEALDKRVEGANKEPRKTKEAKKPKKAPAPKAITLDSIAAKKVTQVSKAQVEAQLADMEDAPF
jgi:hypothetical protein